jgi:tRNA(Ile)-lysidine synthase
MLREKVREAIVRHGMLEREDRAVVAVSGGVDSVVLVRVLASLASEFGWDLTIAHLDHRLRTTSDGDARFVVDLGRSLGIPVVVESTDVGALARASGMSVEQAARSARRSFLEHVAADVGATRIALGHTADDQAETILFRLTRGTGWDGARGMEPVAGLYVRPLLRSSRSDVLALARAEGWAWREDETNADPRYARNRIRHRVLPELERINPAAVAALARVGESATEAAELASYVVGLVWPRICLREEPGRIDVSRAALCELPGSIQGVVLREALRRLRGDLEGIERVHVAGVKDLAGSPQARGELHLPRGFVRLTRETVAFTVEREDCDAPSPWSVELQLGRTEVPSQRLSVDLAAEPCSGWEEGFDAKTLWSEVADVDRVCFPLLLRNRRTGDRFAPLGMAEEMKLKDFFIRQHVPWAERDSIPLLCDQEKVVWVVGMRLSHRVRTSASTRKVLRMRVEKESG